MTFYQLWDLNIKKIKMSTKVEYRNSLGSIVTEQQKNNLSEHFKLTYDLDTNKLKTKLHYFDKNVINEGVYYMDPNEDITNVITQINPSHRWGIMSDLQVINGYKVWRRNYFQNGELSDVYSKEVFNTNGDYVAGMGYDNNDQPTRGSYKKFDLSNKNMIDEDGDVVGVFEDGDIVTFGYGSDGSFTVRSSNTDIFFKPYITLQSFLESQQNGFVMNLMTQEMKEYYLNFQPLVPPF
jgi:sporulation protein YlmC with PRC-barrel domain